MWHQRGECDYYWHLPNERMITKGETRKGLEAQLSKRLGVDATYKQIIAARIKAAEVLD